MRVHVSIDSDQEFARYFGALEESARISISETFGHGHTANVRASEGSLVVAVTILGSALLTAGLIASYPNMKAALVELVDDTKRFATLFKGEFVKDARINPSDVDAFEAEPLAPKLLLELAHDLKKISAERKGQSDIESSVLVSAIARKLRQLRPLLSEADRNALIADLELSNIPELAWYKDALGDEDRAVESRASNRLEARDLFPPVGKAGIVTKRRKRSKSKTIHI